MGYGLWVMGLWLMVDGLFQFASIY